MHFHKYHGLGNDYLVIDPAAAPGVLARGMTRRWAMAICERQRGIGADGIVYGPLQEGTVRDQRHFACQIWNPDGSLAEVSGNGLRIFARYLLDAGYLPRSELGAAVSCTLFSAGRTIPVWLHADGVIAVEIGHATVHELLFADLGLGNRGVFDLGQLYAVNVGNPHCVFFPAGTVALDGALARHWGPQIEHSPHFPNRTNVQFARPLQRHRLQIEIWERGAGYTLSSGSSSCAAAVAAVASGRCQSPIAVEMAGGTLTVDVENRDSNWYVTLVGAVIPIYSGHFADPWLDQ
jgi:diaminopimelate epimerase